MTQLFPFTEIDWIYISYQLYLSFINLTKSLDFLNHILCYSLSSAMIHVLIFRQDPLTTVHGWKELKIFTPRMVAQRILAFKQLRQED